MKNNTIVIFSLIAIWFFIVSSCKEEVAKESHLKLWYQQPAKATVIDD